MLPEIVKRLQDTFTLDKVKSVRTFKFNKYFQKIETIKHGYKTITFKPLVLHVEINLNVNAM